MQVSVEGGPADAEGRCHLVDALAAGDRRAGGGQLGDGELTGPSRLLALDRGVTPEEIASLREAGRR
jgi:hypothetical protein